MSNGKFLQIEPPKVLQFRFELKKQITCSIRLINNSCNYVAFKLKSSTDAKKYCVTQNTGVVSPNSASDVTITMGAQKEAPKHMRCADKFLVQSIIVNPGFTKEDIITNGLFQKEKGNQISERQLTVSYVSHHPPPPVLEIFEDGFSRVLEKLNTIFAKSEYISMSSVFGIYHQLPEPGKNISPECEAGLTHQCVKSIISETDDSLKDESQISAKDHYYREDHYCNPQSEK